ncbi:MAG: hypothetical protein A3G52_04575 [Candidatus Taylorbacteria bacterium RIFCSPLOWO2_12_FULL_43_20]|uniref:AI-2E family transporter n=1 Tax=Candidatus Taylorbacteria bacterium RIFCSPLOWO2_12_FULL_43_20 TaxID=1802332 RepID=A0A1G2P298_9BACT|nr:MAG: hypothetical protein A2825_02575 [Candidatus Taylorbacteria bacterium RIFCSPHIGHO2_01_FULL_43_120]OHA22241.1 MAG: hypothetical protein A3B98_02775 [Candidatus Taylorbacteria bacterium RIFCSPHIGHO2_02_FULL_43_55]OHA28260.1 MAG: hypothetical protein A3E92_02875 [Candidatus Taylorbacteria bacterium RIFCSPHIGHO2_12_FULL_42_34]OHA30411.1 MAG: hypothetical protein A3B09_03420 [Candidatus Taylorbacteria bacterium RIFCSPLOWO2_01_FULL_43_83]OHA39665.1 MAG: hypothetical protein A3H58_02215 [Candi
MEPNKKMVLDVTPGTITKIILICLFFIFLFLIRDIILIVLAAIVLASSVEPVTVWFVKHNIKRTFAVIIVYLSLALIFMGVVYFFLPQLIREFSNFIGSVSEYMNIEETPPEAMSGLLNGGIAEQVSNSAFTLRDILNSVSNSFSDASRGLFETISIIFGGIFSFILIAVLSFYFAVQEEGISNFLRIITPKKHENYVVSLWKRSQQKIGLWMQGQLLLAVIVGILVYLGLTILGVRHALLLAFLAAIFELIPIFGPLLSAIPAILIAATDSGIGLGLAVALLYLLIQQFENHLIYPLVVRKIVGVSPVVVILALIIGAKLAGFLGVLLSVPIAAALMEYFNDLQKDKNHDFNEPTLMT